MTVKYTKAIRNDVLKTTEMEVGSTVVGTVAGYTEGRYGNILLLDINGRQVKVFPSGNLKKDSNASKYAVGTKLTITRTPDVTNGNFVATTFDIKVGQDTTTTTDTSDVQQRIAELKAGNGAEA